MSRATLTETHGRLIAVAFAAVACAATLAACGSSGQSSTGSASAGGAASSGIKLADCMRSHGVPNFPDPGPGGGTQISSSSGINPQSPAFQSAQHACAKFQPFGGAGRAQASKSQKLTMLKQSECMRAHGLPTFPDPVSTAPNPSAGGFAMAFGRPGAVIVIPQSIVQSPAFIRAAAACHLPGGGRPNLAKTATPPG